MPVNGLTLNEALKLAMAACLRFAPYEKRLLNPVPASRIQIINCITVGSEASRYEFFKDMEREKVVLSLDGLFTIDMIALREYFERKVLFRAILAVVDSYSGVWTHDFKAKVDNPQELFRTESIKWKELKWMKAK